MLWMKVWSFSALLWCCLPLLTSSNPLAPVVCDDHYDCDANAICSQGTCVACGPIATAYKLLGVSGRVYGYCTFSEFGVGDVIAAARQKCDSLDLMTVQGRSKEEREVLAFQRDPNNRLPAARFWIDLTCDQDVATLEYCDDSFADWTHPDGTSALDTNFEPYDPNLYSPSRLQLLSNPTYSGQFCAYTRDGWYIGTPCQDYWQLIVCEPILLHELAPSQSPSTSGPSQSPSVSSLPTVSVTPTSSQAPSFAPSLSVSPSSSSSPSVSPSNSCVDHFDCDADAICGPGYCLSCGPNGTAEKFHSPSGNIYGYCTINSPAGGNGFAAAQQECDSLGLMMAQMRTSEELQLWPYNFGFSFYIDLTCNQNVPAVELCNENLSTWRYPDGTAPKIVYDVYPSGLQVLNEESTFFGVDVVLIPNYDYNGQYCAKYNGGIWTYKGEPCDINDDDFWIVCEPKSLYELEPSQSPSTSTAESPSSSTAPSNTPSDTPSQLPSKKPTGSPTSNPSMAPSLSASPSVRPSPSPSLSTMPSVGPSASPSSSIQPSRIPTQQPSAQPSRLPTGSPTALPSQNPSGVPSKTPTKSPTTPPSASPSRSPSRAPTPSPSASPSRSPSRAPSTSFPSQSPSSQPSDAPIVAAWQNLVTETFESGDWDNSILDLEGGRTDISSRKSFVGDYSLRMRDESWVKTKPISIPETATTLQLSFQFRTEKVDEDEEIAVWYQTDVSSPLWTELGRFAKDDTSIIINANGDTWTKNKVWLEATLPPVDVSSASEISFEFQSFFSSKKEKLYIDQIKVDSRP